MEDLFELIMESGQLSRGRRRRRGYRRGLTEGAALRESALREALGGGDGGTAFEGFSPGRLLDLDLEHASGLRADERERTEEDEVDHGWSAEENFNSDESPERDLGE